MHRCKHIPGCPFWVKLKVDEVFSVFFRRLALSSPHCLSSHQIQRSNLSFNFLC